MAGHHTYQIHEPIQHRRQPENPAPERRPRVRLVQVLRPENQQRGQESTTPSRCMTDSGCSSCASHSAPQTPQPRTRRSRYTRSGSPDAITTSAARRSASCARRRRTPSRRCLVRCRISSRIRFTRMKSSPTLCCARCLEPFSCTITAIRSFMTSRRRSTRQRHTLRSRNLPSPLAPLAAVMFTATCCRIRPLVMSGLPFRTSAQRPLVCLTALSHSLEKISRTCLA